MLKKASIKRFIRRIPIFGRGLAMLFRLMIALRYFTNPIKELIIWLFKSNETTNFTYDLHQINKYYLAAFVAQITQKKYEEILRYITEIENHDELKKHIQACTRASKESHNSDLNVKPGRRLGWYAVVRAVKPKVVIETGVDKGLGACVLTAALIKNSEEGYKGHYFGTDINPKAGYLLQGKYASYGDLLSGDSIELLKKFNKPIDVFINDSNHAPEYEAGEYEVIRDKLSKGAIILGDNSHVTSKLLEFALNTGRQFLFFQEKPYRHWYPGGGIGAAFSGE